jgi:peptidoglycan/LPS O-acetylase OafA/YrhL
VTVAVTLLFVLGVWVFAGEEGAVSRWLDTRPLVTLGRWSFSIYMVHMFVIVVTLIVARKLDWMPGGRRIDFGSVWLNDLFAVGLFVGIVGLALLAHRFVEIPAQRWIDRKTKPAVTT